MAMISPPAAGYDLEEYERLSRAVRRAEAAVNRAADPDDLEFAHQAVETARTDYQEWVYANADALFRELRDRRIRARR